MLHTITTFLSDRLRRWIPDPFVFALALTLLVAALSLMLTDAGINQVLEDWYRGFWSLLEFSMQMVLMLATGYAIALSPLFARLTDRLALLAKTPGAVYLLVMVVGGLFSLISWGWIVLTAILARELAKRVNGIDYAYLVACVYVSMGSWVGGLSSTIPLLLNTEGNFLIETGVLDDVVPVATTLGSSLNWLYVTAYILTVPLLLWMTRPKDYSGRSICDLEQSAHKHEQSVTEEAASHMLTGDSLSDRLNNGIAMQFIVALAALWYVARHFADNGFDLNLNIMIFLFLSVGLMVHATPMCYVMAMKRACSNVSGIIFQYPFYAGIMGIMMFSGLGPLISDWLAGGASVTTLPLLAQLSGAVMNFTIPSAGGEWAVIGPALTETAIKISSSLPPDQVNSFIARIAMATAYGEASTNLLQPFYLLIILPVMGAGVSIQARDVLGYLIIPFLYISFITALLVIYTPL